MDADRIMEVARGEDSLTQIAGRLGLSVEEQTVLKIKLYRLFGPEASYILKGILQGIEAGRNEVEWGAC